MGPYAAAIRRTFGPACVLGQVIKKLRKGRIVSVGRKLVIGSTWKLEDALLASEEASPELQTRTPNGSYSRSSRSVCDG